MYKNKTIQECHKEYYERNKDKYKSIIKIINRHDGNMEKTILKIIILAIKKVDDNQKKYKEDKKEKVNEYHTNDNKEYYAKNKDKYSNYNYEKKEKGYYITVKYGSFNPFTD